MRLPGSVSSSVAVVAAVRVQLSQPHRLASPVAPPAAGLSAMTVQHPNSSLRSSRGSNRRCTPVLADRARIFFLIRLDNPSVTEPTLALRCRAKYRHASAAPLAGLASFATAPLHFISATQAPLPFHCVPTVTNCRDRHGQRCARRCRTPEAAMLRISAGKAIWPQDFVRPKTTAIAPRGFARCKASAIVAVTIQLSRRSAGCACETGRHRWKN